MNAIPRTLPWRLLLPALFLALLAGCDSLPSRDNARLGPFFHPTNVYAAPQLPANIRRVAIMPVGSSAGLSETTLDQLDGSVVRSLNEVQRFESVPITRAECARITGKRFVLSTDQLPYDFIQSVTAKTAADAILFIDITHYSPYPPQTIDIRSKLVRLDDQSILWSIDQTFSATDPSVVNAVRRQWYATQPPGIPADMSINALDSPSRFADYAFTASFATMPPRKR